MALLTLLQLMRLINVHLYVERIVLALKVRKLDKKWRENRPFLAKTIFPSQFFMMVDEIPIFVVFSRYLQ